MRIRPRLKQNINCPGSNIVLAAIIGMALILVTFGTPGLGASVIEIPSDTTPTSGEGSSTPTAKPGAPTDNQFESKLFCYGNVGYGPLRISSESPFQSLRLGFTPRTPSTLLSKKWEVGLSSTLANVWSYENDRFLLDYEGLHTAVHAAYGLTDNWMIEFAYDERRLFGGILDGLISDFHKAFGIDQDYRDQYPNGRVYVDIRDENGQTLAHREGGGLFSQGFAVTIQNNLTCGSEFLPAFAYALTTRYEFDASNSVDRDLPFDFGASVMLAHRLGPLYGYLTGCYFWYGGDQVQQIRLKPTQLSGLLALEWRYLEKQSLILQYLASEGQAKDLGPFSETSHEVTLGWKWEFQAGWLLEFGMIENFIIYDNSPDFGLQLGIICRP